jgi:hypothetical protein
LVTPILSERPHKKEPDSSPSGRTGGFLKAVPDAIGRPFLLFEAVDTTEGVMLDHR